MNMKGLYSFLVVLTAMTVAFAATGCRGNSARKAADIAKKYVGKTISGAKKTHLERYADDVAQFKFVEVPCSACYGSGMIGNTECETCGGDGAVYKVERR